jgi:hypothetical protein
MNEYNGSYIRNADGLIRIHAIKKETLKNVAINFSRFEAKFKESLSENLKFECKETELAPSLYRCNSQYFIHLTRILARNKDTSMYAERQT